MTLREAEISRSRRALRKSQKHQHRRKQREQRQLSSLLQNNGNRVLTFREWCLLNGISERTGRRIIKSGHGPTVTQLSLKRIGITIANNADWQAARART